MHNGVVRLTFTNHSRVVIVTAVENMTFYSKKNEMNRSSEVKVLIAVQHVVLNKLHRY